MGNFNQLGLSTEILEALAELGFETPTEIQSKTIPHLLEKEKDLIGLAQTGTGKTAAFGLPLLEKIDFSLEAIQGLVLAPTRELGRQIGAQLELFSKHIKNINILTVYGGAPINIQIKGLKKKPHIVIATPGRLIDLIDKKAANLNQLRFLVLDEADEMLNMGFKEEIDRILQETPDDKLTWLFSATMPKHIKKVVQKYMDKPIEVNCSAAFEVNENIKHLYVKLKNKQKTEALTRFLDTYEDIRTVVFCRTKRDTQNLAEFLLTQDYKVDALHGDLAQPQRERVMNRFRKNEINILIATDVAARGIDVNDLTHVFHFSLPENPEYYTHRSGRTARAGKRGVSIAFQSSNDGYKIKDFSKKLNIKFKNIDVPELDQILKIRLRKWCKKIVDTNTSFINSQQKFTAAYTALGHLSKEELIDKFMAIEFQNLKKKAFESKLSERSSGKSKDRQGSKSRKNKSSKFDRSGKGRRSKPKFKRSKRDR